MPTFEGCAEAREISLTRKAAQPRAVVLMTKNAGGAPILQQPPENIEMATQAEINKAALGIAVAVAKMDEVTKSYWLGLGEDAQTAFIAKSAADQKSEADAAKALADRTASEAEAAKSGKTVRELELEKRLETQGKEIETLKAARVEDEIEKRAANEFDGYPGGAKAVVPLLKAYATLPEEARLASEAVLKAQCTTAKTLTTSLGQRSEEQVSKAAGAQKRIDEAVAETMKTKNISKAEAHTLVIESKEYAADVAAIG